MGEEAEVPVLDQAPENPEQGVPFELKEPSSPEEWAAAFALRKKFLDYPEYGNDAGEDEKDHSDNTYSVVVLDHESQVIGTGRISFKEGDTAAEISRMAVDSSAQNKGIGKAVVDALEAKIATKGAKAIELNTAVRTNAEGFYSSLGYQTLEYRMVPLGHGDIEVVRMHKDLGDS